MGAPLIPTTDDIYPHHIVIVCTFTTLIFIFCQVNIKTLRIAEKKGTVSNDIEVGYRKLMVFYQFIFIFLSFRVSKNYYNFRVPNVKEKKENISPSFCGRNCECITPTHDNDYCSSARIISFSGNTIGFNWHIIYFNGIIKQHLNGIHCKWIVNWSTNKN